MQRDIEMVLCNQWQSHIFTETGLAYYFYMGANCISQDDNGGPHRAGFIRDRLQNLGVDGEDGMACQHFNTTEDFWDQLGHAVCDRLTDTTTLVNL